MGDSPVPPWAEKLISQQATLLGLLESLATNQAATFRELVTLREERLDVLRDLPLLMSEVSAIHSRFDELTVEQTRGRSRSSSSLLRQASGSRSLSPGSEPRLASPEVASELTSSWPTGQPSNRPSLMSAEDTRKSETWALIEADDEMRSMLKDVRKQVDAFADRNDKEYARKVSSTC
jgi:hypothetical protein